VQEILRDRGVEFDVVEYLKQPLDRVGLERILDAIPDAPDALVRKDKRFGELGLRPEDYVQRDAVIRLLLAHPDLMQRPVVFRGSRALIARPSEKVLDLLD
jgi:arsenate reductase (glutaredoxin)